MRFLGLLLLAALVACGTAPQPPLLQQQTVAGLTIALEAADNATINAGQEFVITLTDNQGQPVDNAVVYLDLTMPAMPMGTNRPVASAEGQGRYRASTAYTMAGAWEITVVADVAGIEHRAVFQRTAVES